MTQNNKWYHEADCARVVSETLDKGDGKEAEDFKLRWYLSLSKDKPFFIDTFRALLKQYDQEEVSLSRLVEILNITAYDWANKYFNNGKQL